MTRRISVLALSWILTVLKILLDLLSRCQFWLPSGKESEAFWWSWIPNDPRGRSRIFFPTPEVQLDHFYITLLSWEFLLNRYNFLWNFCWNREFLLPTTISNEC